MIGYEPREALGGKAHKQRKEEAFAHESRGGNMEYDAELIRAKLGRWQRYLGKYCLPSWDEIPDVGLYMEQVLAILKHYLDYLPPELKEEQFITAATINNYVQKKFMPEPIKKRYYRVHLAYMIMICTLKHSLSIATLQRLIPMGIEEDEVKRIYSSYAACHKVAVDYFTEEVRTVCAPLLTGGPCKNKTDVDKPAELIVGAAVVSAFARLLAEKLLLLEGKKVTDITQAELK